MELLIIALSILVLLSLFGYKYYVLKTKLTLSESQLEELYPLPIYIKNRKFIGIMLRSTDTMLKMAEKQFSLCQWYGLDTKEEVELVSKEVDKFDKALETKLSKLRGKKKK